MITNDVELEVVRRQLARVDAAIEDMRANVLPKSERMFNLMTEAPRELRQSLQADIDAYLRTRAPSPNGATPAPKEPSDARSLELT
jgi:uncharacterized protein involved in exopolysaccharide biosynthesis